MIRRNTCRTSSKPNALKTNESRVQCRSWWCRNVGKCLLFVSSARTRTAELLHAALQSRSLHPQTFGSATRAADRPVRCSKSGEDVLTFRIFHSGGFRCRRVLFHGGRFSLQFPDR